MSRAAILTVSDRCASGEREDRSGPALIEQLTALGFEIVAATIVPDEIDRIRAAIAAWRDADLELVVVTGGTGIAPRDVTPEALEPLLDKQLPGFAEHIRRHGQTYTPAAILSRGLVGVAGRTLVLALPGSTKGATQSLEAIADLLDHAIDTIRGRGDNHH